MLPSNSTMGDVPQYPLFDPLLQRLKFSKAEEFNRSQRHSIEGRGRGIQSKLTCFVLRAFSSQSGGYEKVGFKKKDIHNQILRQRKLQSCDAAKAIRFLREFMKEDRMIQLNYQIYGDLLAFDATYKKNKYLLPLVVFSGVNNHDRACVFVAAVIANEFEETYIWLLKKFSTVMKSKEPSVVITDGDLAMKNAIKKLKRCMMSEYDVGTFQRKWTEMVTRFELQDNPWVQAMYEKKRMCAAAYMRRQFFAGFRTTSRCEDLHSELGSVILSKVSSLVVRDCSRLILYFKYIVATLRSGSKEWHVSFTPSNNDYKCSCFMMESQGLPCEHILAVLVHQQIEELPQCLILKQWTKGAKNDINVNINDGTHCWDSQCTTRSAELMALYRIRTVRKSKTFEKFNTKRERLLNDAKEDTEEEIPIVMPLVYVVLMEILKA
ncbi:Zinc finger, PMZ-type [Sesbania bispinosa]|nr:Zinc finger, PMZ-type [Sesbania bispinosa]